jgi:hypothetical protein
MADFMNISNENKTLNFPEEIYIDEQGLSFHIIEKGTKIYRGDSHFNKNKTHYSNDLVKMNNDMLGNEIKNNKIKKNFVFFGFSQQDIEKFNYGRPFEFEVIKEDGLRLLRVDNIETLQLLHNSSNSKKIKKIIEENYILNDTRHRDSKKVEDYAFIKYLCKTYPQYDGYISDKTQQNYTKLNAEMAICDPISKVKLNRQLKGNKTDEQYDLDLTLRLSDVNREKKRKKAKTRKYTKKRRYEDDEYEDEDDEDEDEDEDDEEDEEDEEDDDEYDEFYSPPKKALFSQARDYVYGTPGGKKKSKKSKKAKKAKKAKKQTRKKKGKKN